MLGKEQKEAIAGISVDELSSPREFMLKHGEPVATSFFSQAAIDSNLSVMSCDFPEEDHHGSLWRGDTAICNFLLSVRGESYAITALLRKEGFDWKLDTLHPDFFDIPAAYPPRQNRAAVAQSGGQRPAVENPQPEGIEQIRLPRASWSARPAAPAIAPLDVFLGMARKAAVSPLLWAGFIVLFIAVMTINYRRLRNEAFEPEWLEDEQQLDKICLSGWWMRTITRLTNRRVLQVRLYWFLSKRKIHAVALDDVHSVAWRRYTNWVLIGVGLYLVGSLNPVALLLVMLGLEAKIHSIRFNTPFAQMLRTNAVVTSLHRKHFDELAAFYRKAQLHWAQVRTQKQMPLASSTTYDPEMDRDFFWGTPVWLYVAVWMAFAIAQRTFAKHVTLDDFVAVPLLLGLSTAIALRSRRDALLATVLGLTGFLTVKFPGSFGFFGFSLGFGADGTAPNFEQYLAVLVVLVIIAGIVFMLVKVSPLAGLFAPLLWLAVVAWLKPTLLRDFALYAKCFLAVGAAVLWSWLDTAISRRWEATPLIATKASSTEY